MNRDSFYPAIVLGFPLLLMIWPGVRLHEPARRWSSKRPLQKLTPYYHDTEKWLARAANGGCEYHDNQLTLLN